MLLTGLSRLSLNMFIPSLPKIAETFGADYDLTAVSISGYLGMTAILQIVVGPCRTGSDGGWRRHHHISDRRHGERTEWRLCAVCHDAFVFSAWPVGRAGYTLAGPSGRPYQRKSLGSGPINLMQFCLKENIRMMVKQRKARLSALSSIFYHHSDVFLQTRRAGSILPLTALKRLENREVSCAFSPCQRQNILPQNG